MLNRVKLKVMGLSYSPMQSGAFALLLAVDGDSPIRIPIVIGPAEAQSIAIRLDAIRSPRPMTHDLFNAFALAFDIRLKEVFIYKFEDGIYSSELTFTNGERTVVLDSRTSDAVAIAMRVDAPIFTTPAIVQECGIELEEVDTDPSELLEDQEIIDESVGDVPDEEDEGEDSSDRGLPNELRSLSPEQEMNLSDEELQARLQHFSEIEDYESAARIQAILQSRKPSN